MYFRNQFAFPKIFTYRACSHSVFLQVCPFELAQRLGDEYLYWGGVSLSTSCARDACCTLSEIAKYPSQVRTAVIAFVLESKSTKSQYCITVPYSLETLGNMPVLDSQIK